MVLEAGTGGNTLRQLYWHYAAHTQCTELVVQDLYVVNLLSSSAFAPAADRAPPEEALALVEAADFCQDTGLKFLEELVGFVDRASAGLRQVRVITRGVVRYDIPAGALLTRWQDGFCQRWHGRGIALSVEVAPKVHARRITLAGSGAAVDICAEWGVGVFQDSASNIARPLDDRVLKRTEVLILETVKALAADDSGRAVSLADDLGVFASRHHVQLQASGDLSAALGALSGEAADELRGILQWHGRQVTAAPAPPAAGAATPRAPGARPAADMRPGDWTCPTCDYHNFASRVMCKRCLGRKDPVSGGAVAARRGAIMRKGACEA